MPTELIVILLLIAGGSGFFLKYYLHFDSSPNDDVEFDQLEPKGILPTIRYVYFKVRANGSCLTPLLFTLLGIAAATQLRDFGEAIGFMAAATAQFASFVFVSRLRQRGSFFWHAMASLASNSTWYITMYALNAARAYWWLYLLYVAGIVVGRVMGAGWSQYIEQRFKLKGDATRDPKLEPGQRLHFLAQEKTLWALVFSLVGYAVCGLLTFDKGMVKALGIVIGLSVMQNFTYALATRVGQRGNNWLIASTGLLAGITFFLSTAYLFSKNMPLLLMIPYMLATTLGSTMGAFMSMILERAAKLAPDKHLDKPPAEAIAQKQKNTWQDRLPYVIIMAAAAGWIIIQKPLFDLWGLEVNPIAFPLPFLNVGILPRTVVILSTALLFLMDEVWHTLMSRAGNRNHTGYHVATCIPKGVINFLKMSYISLNPKIPDIIPIAICAGCLGSLFGKDISERIEKWLQARMDPVRSSPDGSVSTV